MNLQVTQENLNRALNNVARVASGRNALPILSNVLIKTIDNRVCVAATDLNLAITHYIGSKVKTSGSITVPARLMQDFVASLPGGVINLNLEENKLHISTGHYNSTINGVPADDYPVMPSISNGKRWNVGAQRLKKALTQTVLAASNDDSRPVLTGVYFYSEKGQLYIAATDSYRLAEKKVGPVKEEISSLIPASSAQDLLRIIGDHEEDVEVTSDDQQALFRIGDVELVTRLIEGKYPDYKKLIPTKFNTTAKLAKNDIQNITKVSSLFARESAGSVVLEVDCEKNEVSINSLASQIGENSAKAQAQTGGESASITINSRYIIDAINVIEGDSVSLNFNEKLEPFVLKGSADDSYTHLIMPLKG